MKVFVIVDMQNDFITGPLRSERAVAAAIAHTQYVSQKYEKQQEYDNIKNKWCIDNDISLIRIPYWKLSTLTIEDLLLK